MIVSYDGVDSFQVTKHMFDIHVSYWNGIKSGCQMQIDEWEQKVMQPRSLSFLVASDLVLCYHIVTFFVHFLLLKPLSRLCFYATFSFLSLPHPLYILCLNSTMIANRKRSNEDGMSPSLTRYDKRHSHSHSHTHTSCQTLSYTHVSLFPQC